MQLEPFKYLYQFLAIKVSRFLRQVATFEPKSSLYFLQLPTLVESLRSSLKAEKTATVEGGEAFLTVVIALRYAGQEAVTKMFKDENNEEIM